MKQFVDNISGFISQTRIQMLLLVGLTLLAYSNTFNNRFVWDDKTFISWDLIRSFDNLGEFLKGTLPGAHQGDYRPLKGIILTIDYAFFGTKVFGYHLQAILIHLYAVLMVYILVPKMLIGTVDSRISRRFAGFIAALIFALHPVQVEAITFVTSSSDIIGIPLMLTAFYFYLDFIEKKSKFKFYLSLFFAFFAFITYEITLILPIILFLYDFCFKKFTVSKIKDYLPYLLIIVSYLVFRFFILKLFEGESYLGDSFYLTMISSFKATLKYFELIFWPVNLSVNHEVSPGIFSLWESDYNPTAVASQKITEWRVLASISILAGLLLAFFAFFKKMPVISFSIGLFLIPLIPVSNIVPIAAIMAERYLYLPVFGFSLFVSYLVVATFEKDFKKWVTIIIRSCILVLLVSLLSGYTILSFLRNNDWQDAKTLWSKTLKSVPQSTIAHHNLGVAYSTEGQADKAINEFKIASATNTKKVATIPLNLGLAYLKNGQIDLAKEEFQRALEFDPNLSEAYYQLGNLAQKNENIDSASEYYKKALEFNPALFDARINLGIIYAKQNQKNNARDQFILAQKINPRYPQSYINLAILYYQNGKVEDAMKQIEKGLKFNPGNQQLLELMQKIESGGKKEIEIGG